MNSKRDGPSYWSVYHRAKKRTVCDFVELNNSVVDHGATNSVEACNQVVEDINNPDVCSDETYAECSSDTDTFCSRNLFEDEVSNWSHPELSMSDDGSYSDVSDVDRGGHIEDSDYNGISLSDQLAKWYLDYGIAQSALNKLLAIL